MSEETLNEKMSDLSEVINESQADGVGTPTSKQHKERMINSLNWPYVLARLVRQGYRSNVLEDGGRYVRVFLAHASITQEATERALERIKEKQKAGQVIEGAAQMIVHMMSKERTNLLHRNSN